MTHEDYRAINALNWSSLKDMADSPRMYRWRVDHPREDSAAMLLGRAIHCAVLEPESYRERYAVRPEGLDGRTKAGKAWAAEVEESGAEVLSEAQGHIVNHCVESFEAHPPALALLSDCMTESVIRWQNEGVDCKARLDAFKASALIDVKTTRALGAFQKDVAKFLYHGQLAWYLDGARDAGKVYDDADAYIIALETSEPYDCAVFRMPEEALDAGRRLYHRLLEDWLLCRASDVWPGRFPEIVDLELPTWADGYERFGWDFEL